jgi:hypothetical protein
VTVASNGLCLQGSNSAYFPVAKCHEAYWQAAYVGKALQIMPGVAGTICPVIRRPLSFEPPLQQRYCLSVGSEWFDDDDWVHEDELSNVAGELRATGEKVKNEKKAYAVAPRKFCWYRRFWSVGRNTAKCSAVSSRNNSPFRLPAHPISTTGWTS